MIKVDIKKALPLVIVVCGLLVAAALAWIKPSASRATQDVQRVPVYYFKAERGDYPINVTATGTVIPAKAVSLRPEISGVVISQSKKLLPGSFFQAGEVLLSIDPREYQLEVERAKAVVEQARVALRLEEGRKSVAAEEWNLFESEVPTSERGRELALRKPQLQSAQAEFQGAKSRLEQAKLNLERTVIRAPFNCVVRSESVDVGQLVSQTTTLASLSGTDSVWVQVSLPVEKLSWVKVPGVNAREGSTADVVLELGRNKELRRQALVVKLLGDLDPAGRLARVLLEVTDPYQLAVPEGQRSLPLMVGAYVRAEIEGSLAKDVVRIPRSVLREGQRVWVAAADDTLEIRKIQQLWGDNREVYIDQGLQAGERVVSSRLSAPLPGMLLAPSEEAGK